MLKISRKSLLIQLIIALVAVIGIFAVVYFTKPKQVKAPVVNPIVDTSDWKIYKNEKYGFEFRYPQEWLIEDSLGSNQCCLNILDGAGSKIQIQYFKNESLSGDTLYINNVKIIKYKGDSFGDALIYYIPLENNQGLRYLLWNKDESYIKISEKIISTFKFTTPTVKPTPATSTILVACTMDAMMCPDGSYVGRSGPKCEFVCPK